MNLNYGLFLEQNLSLSMAQIQSLEILSLDTQELRSLLNNEYLENPMLDYHGTSTVASQEMMSYQKNYHDLISDKDKFMSNLPVPERVTIRQYLLSQLPKLTRQDENLAEYIIDNLEDEGFLSLLPEEIAENSRRTLADVKRILAILEEMEPYGIFQPDRQHCLMKQMEIAGKMHSKAYLILKDHYQELLHGKINVITRSMKISTAEARKCIEEISRLNPHPLQGFNTEESHYIEPDIIAKKEDGVWTIRLNDDWVEDYGISDYYVSMMNTTKDPELLIYFENKLKRARMLINNIVQRRKTIEAVTRQLLIHQSSFFEDGGFLLPLTMSKLAEEMGISTSTVSRAVRGKYLQHPRGTILLKDLFSSSVFRAHGNDVETDASSTMVKKKIQDLIQAEDKTHPISDQTITEKLKQEGLQISRRAVAKYRDELGIRSSFDRKQFNK